MQIIKDLQSQIASYYDSMIAIIPRLAVGMVVVLLFSLLARYVRRQIVKILRQKSDDILLTNFLGNAIRIVNIILAILIFLYFIGHAGIAGSVIGAAGVSAIVIGFAFKDIAENFLAGVIMAFNRPFRLGDTIQSGDIVGSIILMNLRDTQLKTFDGKDVFIPNGQILKNPLYNYTIDGFLRKQFTIGLDYGTDIEKAREIILSTMKNIPGILQDQKPPQTLINDFGSSTINIVVQYWIDTFDKKHSSAELNSQGMRQVLESLDKAGINMPGEVIELKNYNGMSLQTQSAQTA